MRYLLRSIVASVLFVVLAAGGPVAASGRPERPNVVIVLADDMGFGDLGCYGGEIETPHIDRLAAHGVRFAQFYNTARCCPTRAALLTGLYAHQAGVGHMTGDLGVPSYQGHLSANCRTIGQVLQQAGYRTMAVGKWHVGSAPKYWPRQRGFDRYYGCPTGGGFYFRDTMLRRKRFLVLDDDPIDFPAGGYVTDLFTDYALQFLREAAQQPQPFFLYLAHIAPHWPLQAKPADIEKYRGRYDAGWGAIRKKRDKRQRAIGLSDDAWQLSPPHPQVRPWRDLPEPKRRDLAHRMAVYAAQIDAIDQNVGRMVALLEELGELDNTVFMLLSDNGCSAEGGPGGFRRGDRTAEIGTDGTFASAGLEWANVSNTPFRKFKSYVHEGGIATPLIVHWPAGVSQPGRWTDQVGHVIDLMPTCIELAGASYATDARDPPTPLEGESLLPALRGERPTERTLYWEHQGNRAIRKADWKLVADHRADWELYHLRTDRTECDDLAADRPRRVAQLAAQWQAWADRCGVLPWPVRRSRPSTARPVP